MLAKRSSELPTGAQWNFEPKWDGFRALVFRDGDEILIQSRDEKSLNRYFPELIVVLQKQLPERCVLFFINEPKKDHRLLAIEVDDSIVDRALDWTQDQVRELRATTATFERDPLAVVAGDRTLSAKPLGKRVTAETVQQCTGCAFRFDCDEYRKFLGPATKSRDVDIYTVFKN